MTLLSECIICCATCLHISGGLKNSCTLVKDDKASMCLRGSPAKDKVYPDWPKKYRYNTYAKWEQNSLLPEELFEI